jgi:hypothetical protein
MNATISLSRTVRRRSAVAAGLAAAVAAGLRPAGAAQAMMQRGAIYQRGMSGGGLAQLATGAEPRLANFGLFASAMQLSDGTALVLGRIVWIEAGTDLRLEALAVTSCVPIPDRTDGAEVRGRISVNGEGDYPFVIRAYDAGRPGSGLDRIEIEVNTESARAGVDPADADTGFSYETSATLVAGDLQWIIEDIQLGA